MSQYLSVFQSLGFAKNEARIYETLLREGESQICKISEKSGVNRRNVYDSINRLVEKGLVFEVFESTGNRYQPVDPSKLSEFLKEKEELLSNMMPELKRLFGSVPYSESVFTYQGIEGWKNYLNDILRIGGDVFLIAGTPVINEPKLETYLSKFFKEIARKKIRYHVLFSPSAQTKNEEVAGSLVKVAKEYRILPEEYSNLTPVAIFADYTVLHSCFYKDENITQNTMMTIIKNREIAESFRLYFSCLWKTSRPIIDS